MKQGSLLSGNREFLMAISLRRRTRPAAFGQGLLLQMPGTEIASKTKSPISFMLFSLASFF
jgi:hypothetical protein